METYGTAAKFPRQSPQTNEHRMHDNFGICQDSPPGHWTGKENEADRENDGKITFEIGCVWN